MHVLELIQDGGVVLCHYLLPGREYTIGRKECDILLPLGDPSISRHHATMKVAAMPRYAVLDPQPELEIILVDHSKHGTFVDRERVDKDADCFIYPENRIRFGMRLSGRVTPVALVLSISPAMGDEAIETVADAAVQLGAYVSDERVPSPQEFFDRRARCIGFLFVAEENFTMDVFVLEALGFGYTLVTPNYLRVLAAGLAASGATDLADFPLPVSPTPSSKALRAKPYRRPAQTFSSPAEFISRGRPTFSRVFRTYTFLLLEDSIKWSYNRVLEFFGGAVVHVALDNLEMWKHMPAIPTTVVLASEEKFRLLSDLVRGGTTDVREVPAAHADLVLHAYLELYQHGMCLIPEQNVHLALYGDDQRELNGKPTACHLQRPRKGDREVSTPHTHPTLATTAAAGVTQGGREKGSPSGTPARSRDGTATPQRTSSEPDPAARRLPQSSRASAGSRGGSPMTPKSSASRSLNGSARGGVSPPPTPTPIISMTPAESMGCAADVVRGTQGGSAVMAGELGDLPTAAGPTGVAAETNPSPTSAAAARASNASAAPVSSPPHSAMTSREPSQPQQHMLEPKLAAFSAAPAECSTGVLSSSHGPSFLSDAEAPHTVALPYLDSRAGESSRGASVTAVAAPAQATSATELTAAATVGSTGGQLGSRLPVKSTVTAAMRAVEAGVSRRAPTSEQRRLPTVRVQPAPAGRQGTASEERERSPSPEVPVSHDGRSERRPVVVHSAAQAHSSPPRTRVEAVRIHSARRGSIAQVMMGGSVSRSQPLSDLAEPLISVPTTPAAMTEVSEDSPRHPTHRNVVRRVTTRREAKSVTPRTVSGSSSFASAAGAAGSTVRDFQRSESTRVREANAATPMRLAGSRVSSSVPRKRVSAPTPSMPSTPSWRQTAYTTSALRRRRSGSLSNTEGAPGLGGGGVGSSGGPSIPGQIPGLRSGSTASLLGGGAAGSAAMNGEGYAADTRLGRQCTEFMRDFLDRFMTNAERTTRAVLRQTYLDSTSKQYLEEGVAKLHEFLQQLHRGEQDVPPGFSTEQTRKSCHEVRQKATYTLRKIKGTYDAVHAEIPPSLARARDALSSRPMSPRRHYRYNSVSSLNDAAYRRHNFRDKEF